MVDSMGYESLSSVVLVAIAALLMFVWAPRKARRGMKRASEHRSDRFSASMHLVDETSATRFNDTMPPITKGLLMQAEQQRKVSRLTPQKIARIRQLRRAAIRRRQILVASLLAVCVGVLALSFALQFSALYALIPFALVVVVLTMGARASAHARAWEAEVAAVARRGAGASQILPQTVGKAARPVAAKPAAAPSGEAAAKADASAAARASVQEAQAVQEAQSAQPSTQGPDTDVMVASEIRAVLDQARAEDAVIQAERAGAAALAAQAGDAAADAAEVAEEAKAVASREPDDATNELERVSPVHALDAFEMAASQDLISFTLGAPRSGNPVKQAEPESMEIKSTRQVAKAVPVEQRDADDAARPAADESRADAPAAQAGDAPASDAPAQDARRKSGKQPVAVGADVEAPLKSSESLGADVDAVIARRGH